jgi:hypothetical protein
MVNVDGVVEFCLASPTLAVEAEGTNATAYTYLKK